MERALKRTPLVPRHQGMGAVIAEHRGWHIARHFTSPEQEARQVREMAGLADWSWISKFHLKGYGLTSPPPSDSRVHLWPLAPGHYLATSEETDREALLATLARSCKAEPQMNLPPPIRVTDVTSVYAALLLVGPHGRDILQKLTSLDVSEASLVDGACAQSGLSHVHAIVLRQDLGDLLAFYLLVGREYAEFVWDSIMHAGHEYRITPFGTACFSLLEGPLK